MEGEHFRRIEIPRIDYSLDMLILYNMGKSMPSLPMLFTEKKILLKRDYLLKLGASAVTWLLSAWSVGRACSWLFAICGINIPKE